MASRPRVRRAHLDRLRRAIAVLIAGAMTATTVLSTAPAAYATDATPAQPAPPLTAASSAAVSEALPVSQQVAPSVSTEPVAVREIPEHRTATSREYVLSNGLLRALYFDGPVNYLDLRTGRYEVIDPTLADGTEAGRPVWSSRANAVRVSIPKALDARGVSIDAGDCAVSIAPSADAASGEAAPTEAAVAARPVSVTERQYPQAFEGATLSYQSRPEGLKESILLDTRPDRSVWAFDLMLDALVPRMEADGSISLVRPSGVTALVIPAPFMDDSSASLSGSEHSDRVHYELSGSSSPYRLRVVADSAWLTDPARVYPISIDPSVITTTCTPSDTYVASNYPSANYTTSTVVWVNENDPSAVWKAYGLYQPTAALTSDLATKKSQGKVVVNSRLGAYLAPANFGHAGTVRASMCSTATTVTLTTVTWNSKPTTLSAWAYAGAYSTIATGTTDWFDMTAMVGYWQSAATLRVKSTVLLSGSNQTRAGFNSADQVSYPPKWQVDYAQTPVVTLSAPTTGSVGAIPTASWTTTDTGTGFPQVQWALEVATSSAGAAIAATGATSAATSSALPVPSGGWVPGTTYFVRVKAATAPCSQTPRLWSAWATGNFTPVLPSPVASLSYATTTSANWFIESDTNGDGLNDLACDAPDRGRGSVTLTWPAAAGATNYKVFMHDGYAYRQVGTSAGTSWSSAGKGIYPTDSMIASLPADTISNPLLPTGGVDLRDDPRPLYAKTAGGSMDATPTYLFKVVAANDSGECTTASPEVTFALDGWTDHLAHEPRHTDHELGEMIGNSAVARLDRGSLELEATDLEIASWGPAASLTRHYSSATSSATLFASGWRFGFEQSLVVSGTVATWIDEAGQMRSFVSTGGEWVAPVGSHMTLASDLLRYHVTTKDRTRYSFLRTTGELAQVSDANGNATTYGADSGGITITAANGQTIRLDCTSGKASRATYATSDGTRAVLFDATGSAVTYYPDAPGQSYTVTYGYGGSGLSTICASASGEATPPGPWGFDYTAGVLTQVRYPGYVSGNGRRAAIAYGAHEATVTRTGAVNGSAADITQSYVWGPEGAQMAVSNPKVASESPVWSRSLCDARGEGILDTQPSGATSSRTFDASGNVLIETDQDGHAGRYWYDADGNRIREVDVRGAETSRTFDAAGNVLTESKQLDASRNSLSQWTYNASGTVTSEVRSISATESATTDYSQFAPNGEAGQTIMRAVRLAPGATPVDLTTSKVVDAFGNLIWQTDAAGVQDGTRQYSEMTKLHLVSATDASGTVTHTAFDAFGRQAETSRTAGDTFCDWRSSLFDADGHVVTETMWASAQVVDRMVAHTFDAMGREVATIDSVAGTTTARFDARGNTIRSWDASASPASVDASATRASFDAAGNQTLNLAPGAAPSEAATSAYDLDGNVTAEGAPDGRSTSRKYDAAGDVVEQAVTMGAGQCATTTIQHDLAGRESTVVAPDGFATRTAYDDAGHVVSAQGIPGPAAAAATPTLSVYNTAGWLLSATEPNGVATEHEYDGAGREIKVTVKRAGTPDAVTETTYDGLGRIVRLQRPDGSVTTYLFDPFGRTLAETQMKGSATLKARSTDYDTLSRPLAATETVGAVTDRITFAGASRPLTTVRTTYSSVVITTTVSGTGEQLAQAVAAPGITSTYSISSRDDQRRATSTSIQTAGSTLTRTDHYDGAGRLTSRGGYGFTTQGLTCSFETSSGRLATEAVGLNCSGVGPATFRFEYGTNGSGAQRLTGWSNAYQNNYGTYAYTYNGDGSLATEWGYSGGPINLMSYSYDELGRVMQAADGNGFHDGAFYTFDQKGRRIGEQRWDYDGCTLLGNATYGWDDADHLGSWVFDATNPAQDVTATFGYDASGQRTRSVVTTSGGSVETTYTYRGLTLLSLESSSAAGRTAFDYLYDEAGRAYAAIASIPGTSPVFVGLVQNSHGDVVELTDRTGIGFAAYRYNPWGEQWTGWELGGERMQTSVTVQPTALIPASIASKITYAQPLRFAGYAYDSFSGLYYLSARYYDPVACQFISPDPAKADGEANQYQYCGGDPAGKIDPSGLRMLDEDYAAYKKAGGSGGPGSYNAASMTYWTYGNWKWLGYRLRDVIVRGNSKRERDLNDGLTGADMVGWIGDILLPLRTGGVPDHFAARWYWCYDVTLYWTKYSSRNKYKHRGSSSAVVEETRTGSGHSHIPVDILSGFDTAEPYGWGPAAPLKSWTDSWVSHMNEARSIAIRRFFQQNKQYHYPAR